MKKIIVLFMFILSGLSASAQAPCSFTACTPMTSSDMDNLFQAIKGNGTVTINGGTITPSGTMSVVVTSILNTSTLSVNSTTSSSGTGVISPGAKSVGIFTSPTFSGTINGVSRNPNTFYSFSTQQPNAVLGTITYSCSAGNVTIDIIQ